MCWFVFLLFCFLLLHQCCCCCCCCCYHFAVASTTSVTLLLLNFAAPATLLLQSLSPISLINVCCYCCCSHFAAAAAAAVAVATELCYYYCWTLLFLLLVSKNTEGKSDNEVTVENDNQYIGEGYPSYDDYLDDDTTPPVLTHEEMMMQLAILQLVRANERPGGFIQVVQITPVAAAGADTTPVAVEAAGAQPDRSTPAATSDSTTQSPAGDRPVSPEPISGTIEEVEGDYIHSFPGPSY